VSAPITWAEATTPITWAAIGINWNSPAKANSATYTLDDGFSLGASHTKGVSISFGVDTSYANTEDVTMPVSMSCGTTIGSDIQHGIIIQGAGTFAADIAQSNTVTATMNPTITFDMDSDYSSVGNMSFSDSITFAGSFTQTAVDSFLWNPESDPTTVWTDVTDPSSIWSDVSDPTSTWTKVDYPD
jgi:hypothetical protein